MGTIQTQNDRGEWVSAIPLPFYLHGLRGRRFRCHCGHESKTEEQYRGHYALVHVMGLS